MAQVSDDFNPKHSEKHSSSIDDNGSINYEKINSAALAEYTASFEAAV